MLRMKIQTIRTLLWTGNVLAIAGIALLIGKMYMGSRKTSKMFQHIPRDRIETAMEVEPTIKEPETGGSRAWTLLDSTWKLNVTGKEPPKAVETEAGEQAKPILEPIAEAVSVEMIMYAGSVNPELSRAALRYPKLAEKESRVSSKGMRASNPGKREPPALGKKLVRAGDSLKEPYDAEPYNAKVLEISPEEVRFSWGGEEVVLATSQLDRDLEVPPRKMAGLNDDEDGSGEPALTDEEARLSRPLDKNGWFIGTDERDRIIAEQEQLSEGIGVGPAYNQRERRMYVKITKLPEGSLAEERGFQVDDVLRQINGNDIVSKSALVRFIQKNPDLTHYSIEIERRGVRIVKTFQIAR